MIENIKAKQPAHRMNSLNKVDNNQLVQSSSVTMPAFRGSIINFPSPVSKGELSVNTQLTSQKDVEMYNAVSQLLATSQTEKNSPQDNISRLQDRKSVV